MENTFMNTEKERINTNIKVGDKVTICDGSYLTSETYPNNRFYIVDSYPEKLGSHEKIKHLLGEVIETNLKNIYHEKSPLGYTVIHDVKVNINGVIFNTCSKFLICHENEEMFKQFVGNSKYEDKTRFEYFPDYCGYYEEDELI